MVLVYFWTVLKNRSEESGGVTADYKPMPFKPYSYTPLLFVMIQS